MNKMYNQKYKDRIIIDPHTLYPLQCYLHKNTGYYHFLEREFMCKIDQKKRIDTLRSIVNGPLIEFKYGRNIWV